jgi:acylphosphatase
MDNIPTEVEFKITGRVQFVLFRDFTNRKANKLGLKGYVKNNKDGSVTVVAQGNLEQLKKLEQKLWQGSLFSKVENIEKFIRSPLNTYSDFKIKYE